MGLRDIRSRLGCSQGELAQASGVGQSTLSKIERGEMNPSARVLLALAQGIRVVSLSMRGEDMPVTLVDLVDRAGDRPRRRQRGKKA